MTQWIKIGDQLGHEEVALIYEAVTGITGVVVDATLLGGAVGSDSIKVMVDII